MCIFTFAACKHRPPNDNIIDPLERDENVKIPDEIKPPEDDEEDPKLVLESVEDLNPIFFDYDRADIRYDQIGILQANARYLRDVSAEKVQIQGHCDERGTEEYNLALGDRRARAVKEYLTALGIPNEKLSTISYGEATPFESGHNEASWSKNRRAHFLEENQN
jgi:peptidoglycan-associated lipoprotein